MTLAAFKPLSLSSTSKVTLSPSVIGCVHAEVCTNTSFPPSSGVMKPKPLSSAKNLTVPSIIRLFDANVVYIIELCTFFFNQVHPAYSNYLCKKHTEMGLFGFGRGKKTKEFLSRNAVIIDVRTPQEYSGGHVSGSINIPLDSIGSKIEEIKQMNRPVIACCASGIRSGAAASQLRGQGIEAMNGGPWTSVNAAL